MAGQKKVLEREPASRLALAEVVQAHLGRASKFADGNTRDWTIFFFFRILNQIEIDKDISRLAALMAPDSKDKSQAWRELKGSLEDPALMNAGLVDQAVLTEKLQGTARKSKSSRTNAEADTLTKTVSDEPAQLFLAWLKLLTEKNPDDLVPKLKELLEKAHIPASLTGSNSEGEDIRETLARIFADGLNGRIDLLSALDEALVGNDVIECVKAVTEKIGELFGTPGKFVKSFDSIAEKAGFAGVRALSRGLLGVCGYELLRQIAPVYYPDVPEAVRNEVAEVDDPQLRWDPAPINFTFTYAGLETLKLDGATLASFPEAFKDGMAARAERLGDTGPSAPQNWHGSLGLKRIHGYFTGGFLVGDENCSVRASHWQRLRDDIRAFNDRSPGRGIDLRRWIGILFRLIGLEIMHIELGEDPYDVDENGFVQKLAYRREHFGFRDGISQPFVDLELGDPPLGGGTPGPRQTWSPVAPGEIYLNRLDEDGIESRQPLHPLLREGSTFVVFRKLEQDVPGFRIFLSNQRPADQRAQMRLASQFMGRWPNGTSLVLAPDGPLELGNDPEGLINDFLYAADDPKGNNCPLGAHVRRTNPRDIGGRNDVRRHRILRRGIAYGGPILGEGQLGDGNARGLLFIAVNSRIDLQFEVIQADWINKGAFLGQAGLGRCPITGANSGGSSDAFLEAGAVAPVVGLPRFVKTRGGDYFFAPGLRALKAIANGCRFETPLEQIPYHGFSMGDTDTPALFDPDRLRGYAMEMIYGSTPIVGVSLPSASSGDPQASRVVFVGRHAHVRRVLSTKRAKRNIIYSVAPYQEAGRRISRGDDLIIGTEPGSVTAPKHKRMHDLLDDAWTIVHASPQFYVRLQTIIKRNIEAALRRTGPSKRIDLVHDLPATAVYEIVAQVFGTPGPDWLTELAVALPFARQHFTELHPDWLTSLNNARHEKPGLATMQIWSILLFADIVGNYDHQHELMALSLQAGSEFLTQLDLLLGAARSRPVKQPHTIIQAFVALEKRYVPAVYSSADEYYADVRMLLMELAGSAIAIIPTAFGSIMHSLLDFGIDLTRLIPILMAPPHFPPDPQPPWDEDGVARLIYETSRLNPVFRILMRRCAQEDDLSGGSPHSPPLKIRKGEWVAALVGAANIDFRAFTDPLIFSLAPFVSGPERKIQNYLLFGARAAGRECWGREKLALQLLKECVKAAGRLQGLRRVAGEGGELQTLVGVNIGLKARFASVLPDWT